MNKFTRDSSDGFIYVFEKTLAPDEVVILKMPPISANKRGYNDIGWQTDGAVDLYGTLASKPEVDGSLWQKIEPYDDVNKTISYLKIVNGAEECSIVIRALLN